MMANIARVFLASVALGGLGLTTDAFARGGGGHGGGGGGHFGGGGTHFGGEAGLGHVGGAHFANVGTAGLGHDGVGGGTRFNRFHELANFSGLGFKDVRSALGAFYATLSDEQKARFNIPASSANAAAL